MPESFVALPPDSTGKKQRTQTVDFGTGPIHQEVVVMADADGDLWSPTESETAGTLAAVGATVLHTPNNGHSGWSVSLLGTFSAGSRVAFEGSLDGTNWFALNGRRNALPESNEVTTDTDADPFGPGPSHWRGNLGGGVRFFRVRCLTRAGGDSINVLIRSGPGVGATFQNGALPSGRNHIGNVGPTIATYSRLGLAYAATNEAGLQSTPAGTFMLSISNPNNSGKRVHLAEYVLSASAASEFRRVRNATFAAGSQITPVNLGGGTTPSVATVRIGGNVTALNGTGGTVSGRKLGVEWTDPVHGQIILLQGESVGFQAAAATASIATYVTWWEETI